MASWKLLLKFLLLTFVFILAQGLEFDEYDDDSVNSADKPNDTNNHGNEYSDLASRLNCTEIVLLHKGVKTDQNETGSIYQTRPLSTTSKPQGNVNNDSIVKSTESTVNKPKSKRSLNPLLYRHGGVTPSASNPDKKRHPHHGSPTTPADMKPHPHRHGSITTSTSIPFPDDHSKSADNSSLDNKTDLGSHTSDCTRAFDDDGSGFNWYQIIVNNGGPPGSVNATKLVPNASEVLEPCRRPINNTSSPSGDLLYDNELIEFEKVYRREKAFLRFAGTTSEFVDIIGQLVWAPPFYQRQFYRISYRKDDTGFYVFVRKGQLCVFEEDPLTINCSQLKNFTPCTGIHIHQFSISPALQASLIG